MVILADTCPNIASVLRVCAGSEYYYKERDTQSEGRAYHGMFPTGICAGVSCHCRSTT